MQEVYNHKIYCQHKTGQQYNSLYSLKFIKPNQSGHILCKVFLHIFSLVLIECVQIGRIEKFLLTLIFKNGSVGDIAFSSKEEIFPKSPLALF
jgi:hypothetical protein